MEIKAFSSKKLDQLDQMGYLPGPRETVVDFTQRIKDLRLDSLDSPSDLQHKASNCLWNLYRIWPKGFRWRFQSEGLRPWELGYQTILKDKTSLIVLRTQHGKSPWHYEKEEILAHELAHAARRAYRHDFFDEFLSFKTSKLRYRRNFGPYFTDSLTLIVVATAIVSSLAMLTCCLFANEGFFQTMIWRFWLSSQLAQILLFCRYLIVLGLFQCAEKRLKKTFGKEGLWWLFRLAQSEAFMVAIFGKKYLIKRFANKAFFLRDRLFARKLSIYQINEQVKGASNKLGGSL